MEYTATYKNPCIDIKDMDFSFTLSKNNIVAENNTLKKVFKKLFDVNLTIGVNVTDAVASYISNRNKIIVNEEYVDSEDFLQILFHEIGHKILKHDKKVYAKELNLSISSDTIISLLECETETLLVKICDSLNIPFFEIKPCLTQYAMAKTMFLRMEYTPIPYSEIFKFDKVKDLVNHDKINQVFNNNIEKFKELKTIVENFIGA